MKIASYPLGTFAKALELAKTVDSLGNDCAHATCAAKMNKKVSGGFKDLIAAAAKYGLVTNKRSILSLTDSYKNYKLSYTLEEGSGHLKKLFLNPPLFQEIYEKYSSVDLPTPDVFEKAIVREFGVPDKLATRISTYFINGAKFVGLLDEQNKFTSGVSLDEGNPTPREDAPSVPKDFHHEKINPESQGYSIHIKGPGINTELELIENSDFLILDAILKKVKNKIAPEKKNKKEDENPKSPN